MNRIGYRAWGMSILALVVTVVVAPALRSEPLRATPKGLSSSTRRCLASSLAKRAEADMKLADRGRLDSILSNRDAFAVMDPHSGRILWHRHPRVLAKRSCQPGSIFKVITAYAALSRRLVKPRSIYRCKGWKAKEGSEGHKAKCWLSAGHGPVNMAKALAYSCNLYFANLGTRLTSAQILQSAREFGLGKSTDSDFPGELSGTLPFQATEQDAARMAIGQGENVRVTPLQVLSLMGAVANGGVLYSPHKDQPSGPATKSRGVLTDPSSLRFIRDALEEASTFGTGSQQKLAKLRVAGKTGTSAWEGKHWKTHAWYMGFAPFRHPELVVVVFIFDGTASREGASLARAVMSTTLDALSECRSREAKP